MKVNLKKITPIALILVALMVAYFLYQRGLVTFWPKNSSKEQERNFSVQVPINDKRIVLSYNNQTDLAFDIANFEEGENWYGDGVFDYSTFYQGKSSLFLTSLEGKKVSINLEKNFDISDVKIFKFLVYLATDPLDIQEFNLIFKSDNASYWFPIRDIGKGWNLLILPKENFSVSLLKNINGNQIETSTVETTNAKINEVVVDLVSRPKKRITVNLDSLWAEKDEDYLKGWNTNGDRFLSIKNGNEGIGLLAVSAFGQRATFENGSARNYTLQAKFIPQIAGSFGFFVRGDYRSGYGYYLLMNGTDTDGWRIYKNGHFEDKDQTIELAQGEIGNFKMEKEQPYWLKAELNGDKIGFLFSTDGRNFTRLGETEDDSFASGGVGIAVPDGGGMVFINDLDFNQ